LSRRITDRNIWIILAAVLLLGVAYGTSIAVLAIHLDAHGIPELAMGGLAAAFATGIILLAVPAGIFVRRFGPKRTMLVALVCYAACVATFPFLSTTFGLSIARFFDGASSACIWVAAETALLSRADKANKAFVMSLYAIALAIGYCVGPFVSRGLVRASGTAATFVAAGVLAIVAAVVIATRLDKDGEARQEEAKEAASGTPALTVFWRVKTSCLATFSYGYFQASVVLFLPLYLMKSKSIPKDDTILITAFFAGGMLAMATWISKIGDRRGHLLVMRALGAIGGAMVASFVLLSSFQLMCAAVFVAGATLASISPVSLALQGVITPQADLGRANAFYNAAYAAGMLIGPPISSLLLTSYGGAAMLFHLAGLWGVFVAFTVVFAGDDPRSRPREAAMLR
jgi:MFS family permease